jgi:hypothetical protein
VGLKIETPSGTVTPKEDQTKGPLGTLHIETPSGTFTPREGTRVAPYGAPKPTPHPLPKVE